MFPELDIETVLTALETNHWDVNRTAEMFLQNSFDVGPLEKRAGLSAEMNEMESALIVDVIDKMRFGNNQEKLDGLNGLMQLSTDETNQVKKL